MTSSAIVPLNRPVGLWACWVGAVVGPAALGALFAGNGTTAGERTKLPAATVHVDTSLALSGREYFANLHVNGPTPTANHNWTKQKYTKKTTHRRKNESMFLEAENHSADAASGEGYRKGQIIWPNGDTRAPFFSRTCAATMTESGRRYALLTTTHDRPQKPARCETRAKRPIIKSRLPGAAVVLIFNILRLFIFLGLTNDNAEQRDCLPGILPFSTSDGREISSAIVSGQKVKSVRLD